MDAAVGVERGDQVLIGRDRVHRLGSAVEALEHTRVAQLAQGGAGIARGPHAADTAVLQEPADDVGHLGLGQRAVLLAEERECDQRRVRDRCDGVDAVHHLERGLLHAESQRLVRGAGVGGLAERLAQRQRLAEAHMHAAEAARPCERA